jgi:uroporphyrin-III C-methyltransferase
MGATGKVYLVGAGPGHPELLTIKAANLIKAADVIVYDRLIQEDVLALAKPTAERIYMGKPVGRHDSRQDEVNELLVHKAREGKTVVRLKGGDPFLFGRGGEEAEYLAEHGVSFDVIPGVSSALSAPLSAGIPVTHRDASSAVAIVTGHFCSDDGNDEVDFNALSKIPTLVFLMGVHAVEQIAKRLIKEGRDPGTPAAIIQMAFWHGEQVATGTLETIAEAAKLQGVKAPATLVIGEVVRLREKLKKAERDLQRRGESGARFAPGPSPQELFRLATAGVGSQMLAWAVSAGVFEALEHPKTVCNLALQIHADADALNDMMQVLVALGLVEARPDGYRNLELASLYLRRNSPQSLVPALMYEVGENCDATALDRFATTGRKTLRPDHAALHYHACESLARYAAPVVLDRVDLGGCETVLVAGWGAATYSELIAARWPRAKVIGVNPALGEVLPAQNFDAVIISGLLGSASREECENVVCRAASQLKAGGMLMLQDDLLSVGASVAPEVALARLARRVTNGNSAEWSVERVTALLQKSGLEAGSDPLAGAGMLIKSKKTNSYTVKPCVLVESVPAD